MKNALKSAALFLSTMATLVAVIIMLPAFSPPLALVDNVASLNTGGDAVYATLQVADATGVVTAVPTAATFVAFAGAPLTVGEDDGSGCITAALATGRITVAARCGVGELDLSYCANDVVGLANATFQGAFHRIRAGATTLIGPTARKSEVASVSRASLGCVHTIVDGLQGDTYEWRYTSGTNADTVTTRHAQMTVLKVLNK